MERVDKGFQKHFFFSLYCYVNENIMFWEFSFPMIFTTHLFLLIVILVLCVIYPAQSVFTALDYLTPSLFKKIKIKNYGLWFSFKWMHTPQEPQNSCLSPLPLAAWTVV